MNFQFALLLFLFTVGFGQSHQYVLQQWKVEDGLPQSTVRCITQTHDGYLWVGTWSGLVRFDGVQMKSFTTGNTSALQTQNIMSLYTDKKGMLWIGTDGGGLVQYSHGSFHHFDSTNGIQALRILSINEDSAGRMWFATELGIYVYNGKKFLHYSEVHGLPFTYANQVAPFCNGKMYLGFVNNGCVAHLDSNDSIVVDEKFSTGGYTVAVDDSGTIWYGARGRGFVKRKKEKEFINHRFADVHPTETYLLRNNEKWLITQDNISIITDSSITLLNGIENIEFSGITVVFQDREGNIWLGKEGDGLILLRAKKIETRSKQNGFPSDMIMSGVQDQTGKIWIGTWDEGLLCAKSNAEHFSKIHLAKNAYNMYALNTSSDGTLWVGTWANGLFSIKNGTVQRLAKSIVEQYTSVVSIDEDTKQRLWVGTAHEGAVCFDGDSVKVWNTQSGMSGNRINNILCARNGDTWISVSSSGVNRITNGMLNVYKKGSGLNDNFASPMYEDDEGSIWIGTNNGLNRWKNGMFSYVTEQQGLFDGAIAEIIQDNEGNFWIGAIHGIYRVTKKELNDAADGKISSVTCLTFGKEDGMLNEETGGGGANRCWKTTDGKLWFSTSKGVVIIDPKTITTNEIPPTVMFQTVQVENIPVQISDTIVLQPNNEKLELEFSGINFSAPKKIRFHYKLEGFNPKWYDVGTKRFVQYTNLAPGEYTFQLKAQNNSGVWSSNQASLHIVVLPKYYETWWFRVMLVVMFLSIGLAAYRIRIRQLEKEKKEQINFSRKLIDSQETERKRIATELHDSLGQNLLIIKNKLLMALQSMSNTHASTIHIEEVSDVVSSTIEEVRSISHNLRPHQLDQLGITKTLRAIVRQAKESTSIEITSEIMDIDSTLSPEEEINLFRIVQESFNNIIKHAQAEKANLVVFRTGKIISVTIADNGKGISSPAGFGISGMQERAKMFGWNFNVVSDNQTGTIITLTISTR